MSEYSHCSICGGSFIGIGNVCPGCEDALSREPLEIRTVERETVNDIIKEARGVFEELRKHGYNVVSLDRMADIIDRIEAAHKREMADEKRISDAVIQSLRDKKLEMAGEIAAMEAEVSDLRALVGEMADELSKFHALEEARALVARAREAIGGKESEVNE